MASIARNIRIAQDLHLIASLCDNIEDAAVSAVDSIEFIDKATNDVALKSAVSITVGNLDYINQMVDEMRENVWNCTPELMALWGSFYGSVERLIKKLESDPRNFRPRMNRFINGSYKRFINDIKAIEKNMA